MPLTVRDLIAPQGAITPALFPSDDAVAFQARVAVYLADAEAKAVVITDVPTRDEAVRAWGYHRAFQDAYVDLLASPATLTLQDQGGHAYTAEQIREVGRLAQQYADDFRALLTQATSDALPPRLGATRNAPATFTW